MPKVGGAPAALKDKIEALRSHPTFCVMKFANKDGPNNPTQGSFVLTENPFQFGREPTCPARLSNDRGELLGGRLPCLQALADFL